MKVLVVGGSGFVGRAVVSTLLAKGHSARVLSRGTRSRLAGVEWVAGSLGDPNAVGRACAGCDAVLYLAGIIAEVRGQTYHRVHREGTVRVLEAARGAGVRRWIQMSALGTRPGAPSQYHATKWAGEQAVRASGIPWTIHRPSVIHGEGDGFLGFFERMSRWSPCLPLLRGGRTLFQPVWVGDVATAMVGSLETVASVGRTYDVCGPERWTLRAMLELMLQVTGRRRCLLPVPDWAAQAQAWMLEKVVADVLGQTPPLCRDQWIMLGEDNVGDSSALKSDLNWNPVGLESALRARWPRVARA